MDETEMDLSNLEQVKFRDLDIETRLAMQRVHWLGARMEYYDRYGGWTPIPEMENLWAGNAYRVAPEPVTYDDLGAAWGSIDPKWMYHARDENGEVWIHTTKPAKASSYWYCNDGEGSYRQIDGLLPIKIGTCDWKDSLVMRFA